MFCDNTYILDKQASKQKRFDAVIGFFYKYPHPATMKEIRAETGLGLNTINTVIHQHYNTFKSDKAAERVKNQMILYVYPVSSIANHIPGWTWDRPLQHGAA